MAQLAGTYAYDSHDLGSSPRSGKNSILFFKPISYAALTVMYTIFHFHPSVHMPNGPRSRADIESPL